MIISSVSTGLFDGFDAATQGQLKKLRKHCEEAGFELHLSVVTYLEGLGGDTMQLFVQAFHEGKQKIFAKASLSGSARVLGWNLYLAEKLDSARNHVAKANQKLAQASV